MRKLPDLMKIDVSWSEEDKCFVAMLHGGADNGRIYGDGETQAKALWALATAIWRYATEDDGPDEER